MDAGLGTQTLSLEQTWRERPLWALVALVLILGTVCMPAEIYPGDPFAMREETRAILLRGELAVDDAVARSYRTTGEAGQYVVDNPRNDRSYSKYGSMAAWMYLLPMGAELLVEGELPPFSSPRRVVYLNIFNIVLSVLVAASIYRTARRFDARPRTAALFVALCFYTTFLWNYLRAHNSEIMQLLFFGWAVTGFLDVLDERRAGVEGRGVIRLWAACAAIFLTKVSYLFIGPLFALGLLVDRKGRSGGSWRDAFYAEARQHVVPCGLMLGAWAALNWVKFGSPLLTGYHIWKPQITGFNGNLFAALEQLAFSPQWSFVVCFPMLLLAGPEAVAWLRRKPIAFGTILGIAVIYVVLIGLLPSWTGAWCYGPRYWIFILPFVALPAVGMLDWLKHRSPAALLVAAVVTAALGSSTWLQLQVNRFPFFAYYFLEAPLQDTRVEAKSLFFSHRPYGWIEYSIWRHRDHLETLSWWRETKPHMPAEASARYEQEARDIVERSNLFFFQAAAEERHQ